MIKKRVEQELGSRADCTAVLAELCRVIPANSSLMTLEFKTVKVQVVEQGSWRPADAAGRRPAVPAPAPVQPPQPERSDRRIRVLLTGMAPTDVDVANLMGQLAACPLFENVHMGYSKPVRFRERPAREFEISFLLAR
jgi:hypothetical protein